jgi:opacity protein-like surface antigen
VVHRILVLAVLAACSSPATAAADWIVSPYIGARFAASTTILGGLEGTSDQNKVTFGSGAGFLTDGILGAEADLGFVPGFFESGLVTRSGGVTTLMGNVIVATPLAVAQYGLRPYVIGGIGLIHAGGGGELLGEIIDSNLFGMNVGAGAMGPITPRSSLRFDVRYFRNLGSDPEVTTVNQAGVELSFWRGTVGLMFRF